MTSQTLNRAPLWQVASASFLPSRRRALASRVLPAAPMLAILLLQVVLTLRLHNVANDDEALYIDAGHQYIAHWLTGAPVPQSYGGFFSGFPLAYPVLAAVLDSAGGLILVRLVSLVMMLGASVCVGAISAHLAGPRHRRQARLLAMLFFVLTGSVSFVGNFATYDATCMLAVIGAASLAITRRSLHSAVFAGVLIASAGIIKYSGASFLPVVVAMAFLVDRQWKRGFVRALCVLLAGLAVLTDVYVPNRSWIEKGIEFTTAGRQAENYRSLSFLTAEFAKGVGLLFVLALLGTLLHFLSSRSVRKTLVLLGLVAAGLAIPVSQMNIHEYTSFDKHLTFAAMFFAPVAGQVVSWRTRTWRPLLFVAVVYASAVLSLSRSLFMFSEWPDSSPVFAAVSANAVPGTYLAINADSLSYYYDKRDPLIRWLAPWTLFGSGQAAITQALVQVQYAGVVYTSGDAGDRTLNANNALVASLLTSSTRYRLIAVFPKHKYDQARWFVWARTSARPSSPAGHVEAAIRELAARWGGATSDEAKTDLVKQMERLAASDHLVGPFQ